MKLKMHDRCWRCLLDWIFICSNYIIKTIEESIAIAQKLASIKLQNVGRLPDNINLRKDNTRVSIV